VRAFVAGLLDELTKLADIDISLPEAPKARPARTPASPKLPAQRPPVQAAPKPTFDPGIAQGERGRRALAPAPPPTPTAWKKERDYGIPTPVEGQILKAPVTLGRFMGSSLGERKAKTETMKATGSKFWDPEAAKKHVESYQPVQPKAGDPVGKEMSGVMQQWKGLSPAQRRWAYGGMKPIDTAQLGRSSPESPPAGWVGERLSAPKAPAVPEELGPVAKKSRSAGSRMGAAGRALHAVQRGENIAVR
jgi:hypothetical protein